MLRRSDMRNVENSLASRIRQDLTGMVLVQDAEYREEERQEKMSQLGIHLKILLGSWPSPSLVMQLF